VTNGCYFGVGHYLQSTRINYFKDLCYRSAYSFAALLAFHTDANVCAVLFACPFAPVRIVCANVSRRVYHDREFDTADQLKCWMVEHYHTIDHSIDEGDVVRIRVSWIRITDIPNTRFTKCL